MCSNSTCVVVTIDGDSAIITDSKLGDASPTITIPLDHWNTTPPADWFVRDGDWYLFRDPSQRLTPALQFDKGEHEVFLKEQADLKG